MTGRASLFQILAIVCCILIAPTATGQSRSSGSPTSPQRPTQSTNQLPTDPYGGGASITVRVGDESGLLLDEQALVKLSSPQNSINLWRTTQDRSEMTFENVPLANYEVEVSAAGYETKTEDVSVFSQNENYPLFVLLRRTDGGDALGLPGQVLVGRARSEAQKGIGDLNAGKLKDAQKHLEKAYKIAPGNADLNYLMAVLSSRSNQTADAESYLKKAISINSKHVRALTMLGELHMRQKDYKGAIDPLQQAVSADGNFWTAHWLLAEAYLKHGDFEKSREEAEKAIQKSKGDTAEVELVLGQALANLGKSKEAEKAFETFVEKDPASPAAVPVRNWIAQLEKADEPKYQQASAPLEMVPANALPLAVIASSADVGISIPTWHPPSVDDEKLPLANGAVCPAGKVIAGAGRSAEHLVDSISRFEATEKVIDQELNVLGEPETIATRKFDYMASIGEAESGSLLVDESHVPLSDQADFPDHITARGLAALALVFHPALRGNYDMTCEGLGQWKGRATWLIYFRQRSDRPNRFLEYQFTNAAYSVALKGRAWIAADNFQIVHLETDLLHPMRQIQLLNQHQSVDYGPVYFRTKRTELWLPKTAEIYFDFRRHRYHRIDSFDDFKLFAVTSSEKIASPSIPTTPEQNQPPRQ
ncbi:MAG TPA: tetratricopeptide repeat protein [Candidatus Acidoferrum sp.]|nr:tetratricopeptide repeat protein [Candidatus Acidoferrum sp.]